MKKKAGESRRMYELKYLVITKNNCKGQCTRVKVCYYGTLQIKTFKSIVTFQRIYNNFTT